MTNGGQVEMASLIDALQVMESERQEGLRNSRVKVD